MRSKILKPLLTAMTFLVIPLALLITACKGVSTGASGAQMQGHDSHQHGVHTPPVTPTKPVVLDPTKLGLSANDTLITTPNDLHKPLIQAIQAAKVSIDLVTYRLTDPDIANALKTAVQQNVTVRVLLDQGLLLANKPEQTIVDDLRTNKVNVKVSSTKFSSTHQESMIVDGTKAFILSMDLAKHADVTRDYGLITQDKNLISEIELVFKTDFETNAKGSTKDDQNLTPSFNPAEPRLVWGPVDTKPKILGLIALAKKNIDIEIENIRDPEIVAALIAAAKANPNLRIRVISPACVSGSASSDPLQNHDFLIKLYKGDGGGAVEPLITNVNVDGNHPYMHAKMILVDSLHFYIGSANLSPNALTKARELGILSSDATMAKQLQTIFDQDAQEQQAWVPDAITKDMCAAATTPYSSKDEDMSSDPGTEAPPVVTPPPKPPHVIPPVHPHPHKIELAPTAPLNKSADELHQQII